MSNSLEKKQNTARLLDNSRTQAREQTRNKWLAIFVIYCVLVGVMGNVLGWLTQSMFGNAGLGYALGLVGSVPLAVRGWPLLAAIVGAGAIIWLYGGAAWLITLFIGGMALGITHTTEMLAMVAGVAAGGWKLFDIIRHGAKHFDEQKQAAAARERSEQELKKAAEIGHIEYKRDPLAGQRLRGAQLAGSATVAKLTEATAGGAHAKLGPVPIPVAIEPRHFMLSGGTGVGKSQAYYQVLQSARARGQRAIVVDLGGEFLKRFYKPGDLILNPFDERNVSWSPFSEMEGVWDSSDLAASIVPDGSNPSENEWNGYAQNILSAALTRLWERGDSTNESLLKFLTLATPQELGDLVAGLPAQTLFQEGAERMLGSVRGIIGSKLQAFSYLPASAGAVDFSIKKWIKTEGDSWLFINVTESQLKSMRTLISAWLDISITGLLSTAPDPDRRIWFVLDEFSSLGKIQSIEALLTKARKFGGVGVLGIQSISQLREKYGRDGAQTLMSCLSSSLILRQAEDETAEQMSKSLGDEEVLRTVQGMSSTDSFQNASSGESWQEQVAMRRLVLASELKSLPDRIAYLKLAGDFPICKITVPVSQLPADKAEAFIPAKKKLVTESVPVPSDAESRLQVQSPSPVPGPAVTEESNKSNGSDDINALFG